MKTYSNFYCLWKRLKQFREEIVLSGQLLKQYIIKFNITKLEQGSAGNVSNPETGNFFLKIVIHQVPI